jgi:signal peptidase I
VAAEKRAHVMREIVETLIFVALVFVISQFAIGSFTVVDTSMGPQLQPSQWIVVNKWAYLFNGATRGDVVVYHNPSNLDQRLVARVIAVPGDTVTVTPTQVIVDGVALQEPYVTIPAGSLENATVVSNLKLGANMYFVLNDSRLATTDSRTFGPVPRSDIVGQASVVFWPLKDIHGISTYHNVFNGISH